MNYASASIGRGIFIGLMLLQTLMIAVLAPAATAGAISSEREHQTLDLLAVTPISSLAIVLGKLVSALAWLFVLILASIPVTALVFVFGGVAPDDVLRGYIVLFATVIGLGSVGIFFSTLTRRTGASTGLTFVATLALVVGSLFLWVFLTSTAEIGQQRPPPAAARGDPVPQPVRGPDGRRLRHGGRRVRPDLRHRDRDRRPADRAGLPAAAAVPAARLSASAAAGSSSRSAE